MADLTPNAERKARLLHKSSIVELKSRISRHLSSLVDGKVISRIGSTYSKDAAVIYALNMTLGTGPLTLPFAFAQSGLLLGAIFLGICASLGYVTATYVIEVLVLANTETFEHAAQSLLDSEEIVEDDGSPIHDKKSDEDLNRLRTTIRQKRGDKAFKIRERMELGGLGRRFLPGGAWQLLYACLFLYTFGCLCVYSVALVTSVEELLPFEDLKVAGITLSKHGIVVPCLAVVIFRLGFADMQKLRALQSIIMLVRVVALIAMLLGACWLIERQSGQVLEGPEPKNGWVWRGIPLVDMDGLPSLFANAVLAFMVHHSLPGLLAPLDDQLDAPKVISTAYSIAYVIYLILGGTALAAFGAHVPQLYNTAFTDIAPPVPALLWFTGQLLCGYPLLILAIYPIVSITFRNNMLDILGLSPPSSDGPVETKDVLSTALATLPPVAVAYFTKDVQALVGIFAGYFGLSLFLLVPCILMLRSRTKLALNSFDYPHRSRWGHPAMVSTVIIAWAAAIAFNTYRLFFI